MSTPKSPPVDDGELARIKSSLRQTEEAFQAVQEDLERTIEERTADLRAEILERMQTENALRESEERYRLLNDTSPNPITVADTSGKILRDILNKPYRIDALKDCLGAFLAKR